MKLHLLGLPHTYTHPIFSCCAFTGKVLRFGPMMARLGYHVIHYGNAGSEPGPVGVVDHVDVLTREEFTVLGGAEPGAEQYGAKADTSTALYAAFNARLRERVEARAEPGDIICLPFGRGHQAGLGGPKTNKCYWVETGIGYRNAFTRYRVYESAAWMYCHAGRETPEGVIMGNDYWWVIPNFYDPADWPLQEQPATKTVRFMGRLNADKGLHVLMEIAARRPDIRFEFCGQGDPRPWLQYPNLHFVPPFHGPPGEGRADYLGTAAAVLMPTRYVEPFGGVAAEALLCGTPVIASTFGAFPEYILHGENGYLCRTLQDWLAAVDAAVDTGPQWSPKTRQYFAQRRFSMWEVGKLYDAAFKQIANLGDGGWYHGT